MQEILELDATGSDTQAAEALPAAQRAVVSFRVAAGEGASVAAAPARRRVAFPALALLLSLIMACVTAEIGLRIFGFNRKYTYPMGSFFEPDDELGYHGKANFTGRFQRADFDVVVEHNAEGFRCEELTKAQSAPWASDPIFGTASNMQTRPLTANDEGLAKTWTVPDEIYVLGDSFVWGYGIGQHDLMTNQLARLVGRHVHNLGLIGAGTVQEYMIFQKYVVSRLRPGDTVVLAFFGNDFGDNVGKHLRGRTCAKLDHGQIEIVPPTTVSAARQWKNWLKDVSCIFNLATYCIDRYRDGQWTRALGNRTQRRVVSPQEVQADTADGTPAVLITRHYLAAIRDKCREKQARFLAVFVPGQAELNEDDVTSTSDLSPPEEIASRAAFDRLVHELDIESVDLLGPMLAAKESGRFSRLTFVHDFHWNAAGNTVAAEVVAAEIRGRDATIAKQGIAK